MAGRVPALQGGYSGRHPGREKPKSMRKSWAMIFRYLGKYKPAFVFALILICVESMLTSIAPTYLSRITDLISDGLTSGNIDIDKVNLAGFATFLLYLFGTLAMYGRNYIMADLAQRVAGAMRSDLNRKMSRLPLKFFDGSRKGDVMSRFTNDSDTVGSALNRSLSVFIHGIVLLFFCGYMMLITNVVLSLVSMLTALAGFVVSGLVVKKTQKYYRSQQSNIGSMYGLISEIYSTHDVVLAYSGAESNKKKFDSINESLRSSGFRSEITMGLLPAVMSFVGNMGYVFVCIIGSVMVLNGEITIGTVVAFIVYEKMYMGPLDMVANSLGNIQAAGAGAERIDEFLHSEEIPEEEKTVTETVEGHVEFRDVHFSYTPGNETIRGFSADILPGQKVAIVGATGAGKTTLVNLLMKFYDFDSGDILIDGRSIRELSRDDVRNMFCMVLQDTWLFRGTIRENIAYCKDVPDDAVEKACIKVGIDKFVSSLPDGLDTVIGPKSALSEGQKQQICIARALVDRSPMLILDEATSSVDTRTETVIQRAIDSMMAGRTCFVIAHRLSTVRNADIILVIKDGNIIEKGTHNELLEKNGAYAELYKSQFEAGAPE